MVRAFAQAVLVAAPGVVVAAVAFAELPGVGLGASLVALVGFAAFVAEFAGVVFPVVSVAVSVVAVAVVSALAAAGPAPAVFAVPVPQTFAPAQAEYFLEPELVAD